MTETVQQFISRGGQIKQFPRGASGFDRIQTPDLKQKIHAAVVRATRRKKKKAGKS